MTRYMRMFKLSAFRLDVQMQLSLKLPILMLGSLAELLLLSPLASNLQLMHVRFISTPLCTSLGRRGIGSFDSYRSTGFH